MVSQLVGICYQGGEQDITVDLNWVRHEWEGGGRVKGERTADTVWGADLQWGGG